MVTSTVIRPADGIDSRSFPDAVKILEDCCEHRTVCRFELVHNSYSTSVTMVRLHPQGLELRMPAEEGRESLLTHSICCVSFSIGPTICAFLGHLIDVRQPKTGERLIVVSVPKQLTGTNLRQSFRVPVIKGAELETIIHTANEQQFVVSARDIAESGIEIEFEKVDHSGLSVGMTVDVELRFRGECVHKNGEVRKISGAKYGLAFSSFADEQGLRQDARLNGFVLSLEGIS